MIKVKVEPIQFQGAYLDFNGQFDFTFPLNRKMRLDHFLKSLTTFVSRNFWVQAIEQSLLTVNDQFPHKSMKLSMGDRIQFDYYRLYKALRGEDLEVKIPYEVLYECDHYIVVNKPSGYIIHRVGFLDYSLVSQVAKDRGETLYIVHRLDKYTSGVCLFARSSSSAAKLTEVLKGYGFSKYYLVASEYKLNQASGLVEWSIGGDDPRIHKKKQKIDMEHGQSAKTRYRYLGFRNNLHYYFVRIFTGRQHQIRVHFQALGAHVYGDELYSYEDYSHFEPMHDFSEENLGLHAIRLRFRCPYDGSQVVVTHRPSRVPFHGFFS